MNTNDSLSIGQIYESLNFKSSYADADPMVEKAKARANEVCQALEHKLEGVIAYYNISKSEYFDNPRDMNALEALENMLNHLKEPLYPYQEFRQ